MTEFDMTEELGLINDKQFICNCEGFLEANDSTRDICERYVDDGSRFFDIVSRYDHLTSNIMGRSDNRSRNTTRFIAPFLKAFGATDFGLHEHSRNVLRTIPEAKRVIGHLMNMMPTFVISSSYEHNMMNISDMLNIPPGVIDCSEVSFDSFDLGRKDAKALRETAKRISKLKLSNYKYDLDIGGRLTLEDNSLLNTMDKIFKEEMKDSEFGDFMKNIKSVGANEKSHFLLDIRKRSSVDLDGTAFIGSDISDMQVMELIKDGGGLSMSFNGTEGAIRGSNISVMSRDCTVAAVIVQEFYNEGMEAVYSLVENWDRKSLERRECPDPHTMKAMLDANPKKLPDVTIVNKSNMKEIMEKNEKYREKLILERKYS